MKSNTVKTYALVLKSINWSESSKIVSLYTSEHGRLEALAKGARRKNSAYQGVLETLNCIEAVIYFSSARELQQLGQAGIENSFTSIRNDLSRTAYALAILELIDDLIHPREGDPVFYDFIYTMMEGIGSHPYPIIVFWYFILKLASYLGFKPIFDTCFICGKNIDSSVAYFQLQHGSLCCPSCAESRNALYTLSDNFYRFLLQLQSTHYKQTATIDRYPKPAAKITDFLMNYLSFHSDQQLHINALQLIVTN